MRDYYDRNYKAIKSRSYLLWGLVMASLAFIMVIFSVLTIVNEKDTILVITGFAAALFWLIASVICIRIYYKDNYIEIQEKAREIAEAVENAVKK